MTPEGTKMDLEGVKIKDFGRLIMTSLDAELFLKFPSTLDNRTSFCLIN